MPLQSWLLFHITLAEAGPLCQRPRMLPMARISPPPADAGRCLFQVYSELLCSTKSPRRGHSKFIRNSSLLSAAEHWNHMLWVNLHLNRKCNLKYLSLFFLQQPYSAYIICCIWTKLVCWSCHNKVPQSQWLQQQSLIISQCEGWKSKMEVSAGWVGSFCRLWGRDGSFDLQTAIFTCVLKHQLPVVCVCLCVHISFLIRTPR